VRESVSQGVVYPEGVERRITPKGLDSKAQGENVPVPGHPARVRPSVTRGGVGDGNILGRGRDDFNGSLGGHDLEHPGVLPYLQIFGEGAQPNDSGAMR